MYASEVFAVTVNLNFLSAIKGEKSIADHIWTASHKSDVWNYISLFMLSYFVLEMIE